MAVGGRVQPRSIQIQKESSHGVHGGHGRCPALDFLAIQLYSAQTLASPLYGHHLFVIFGSFCADSLRAMAAPPRATPLAMFGFRVLGPLGDRTLPTQAKARVGSAGYAVTC